VKQNGSYMPNENEEILEVRHAYVLTDKKSINLRAQKNMTDAYDIERRAGEEWLIGINNAETHILDVKEEFVKDVHITSLTNRQYCYIVNPIVDGKRKFG
jgi:major vault protein